MQGRYEVADLLNLRASPLVAKPPGLPPVEEWMGPAETRTRGPTARAKIDDTVHQTEGFQKRPTLLDGRRSTTDPDRIHLGPPRHSFASSNPRTRNGAHERTKTNEDEPKSGFGGLNGKFSARHDEESDTFERPRRRYDDDAFGDRPKRDYDRPRWGARDSQPDATSNRRIKHGELEADANADGPVWRRGARSRDFDALDAEPEWAETDLANETNKTHTHEDFLQFMEKMRNKKDDPTPQPEMQQKDINAPSALVPQRVVSDSSASVDKFFAKFEEKKANDPMLASKPTKSRFASIFGSKEEARPDAIVTAAQSPPPLPQQAAPIQPEPMAASDDPSKGKQDVAFAKLLQMLNKNQTTPTSSTPPIQASQSPLNISELASTRSPEMAVRTASQPQTRTPIQSHTPNLSIDRLIESRSPAQHNRQDQPAQTQPKAGAQDLLDLLRRSNIQDKHQAPHHPSYLPQHEQRLPPPPPGLSLPVRDTDRPGPPLISTRRENPRSIFDDPAFTGYRNEQDFQQRSPPPQQNPAHGGLGNLFAAMNTKAHNQNAQEDLRQGPGHNPVPPPPGLQRPPPGLDNGPRPPPGVGWPSNQQHRQPMPPQYTADPRQLPYDQNRPTYPQAQHQQPRQMPHRKPTNELSMPPGFANPPPGFGSAPNYTSPISPDSAVQYAMRGGYGMNERERMERQQQQQNPYLPRMGGAMQMPPPGFR